jgi:hypothetical protein
MEDYGKSLMDIRREEREKLRRIFSLILSVTSIVLGAALAYVGYSEESLLGLFFYFLFGLGLVFVGFQIFLMETKEKTKKVENNPPQEQQEKPDVDKCPHCGADITTAGKFCGSCGRML